MKLLTAAALWVLSAQAAGPWSAPAEVRSDDNLCLTYRARLDGPYLVIRAKVEPGWHTFAMDNKVRAEEIFKQPLEKGFPTAEKKISGIV